MVHVPVLVQTMRLTADTAAFGKVTGIGGGEVRTAMDSAPERTRFAEVGPALYRPHGQAIHVILHPLMPFFFFFFLFTHSGCLFVLPNLCRCSSGVQPPTTANGIREVDC